MAIRDDLHALVDALPEGELDAAQRVLESLTHDHEDTLERLLMDAPYDDEPVSPDEERRAAEARDQFRRGKTISAAEIKRTLLS
ncbi:MAG: hypothetical protein ACRDJH_19590 [Thermomicrobiales bacterium]